MGDGARAAGLERRRIEAIARTLGDFYASTGVVLA
jgi:hypothetical protein